MHPLLKKLTGGDRRSIGSSRLIAAQVLRNPELFAVIWSGIFVADPVIRMRSADAIEKVTASRPDLLAPHKKELLKKVTQIDQQEVRWHAAQLLGRVTLTAREREQAVEILLDWLKAKSNIVRVCALQTLADFVANDSKLRPLVLQILQSVEQTGSAAVRSRARKLLQKFAKLKVNETV
jgi:hypothetical protein